MKKPQKIIFGILSYVNLFLNFVNIVLGFFYLLIHSYNIAWDILGISYMISLVLNMLNAYISASQLNRSDATGNKINIQVYGYFIFIMISMGLMLLGTFLYSTSYEITFIGNLPQLILIYIGFFGSNIYGMIISYRIIFNLDWERVWNRKEENIPKHPMEDTKTKGIIKIIIRIISAIIIVALLIMCIVMFFGTGNQFTGWIGVGVGQFSAFYAFIALGAMFSYIKTHDRKTKPVLFYGTIVIGLVVSGLFTVPILSTPSMIQSAETSFTDAWGTDYLDRIDDADEGYMLQSPFSIPEYFLGSYYQNSCIVQTDISFYNGTEGKDEGLRLYFDAYLPLTPEAGALPGRNSTIIRIHGGGWAIGDKGRGNMLQMNKYLASQGYCVFDIQYGLMEDGIIELPIITPDYVLGDFNITDMLRHIGIFTKYLGANHSLYGANINSVFISGGSAGGQLTCAAGLAMANGSYSSLFGSDLTIKGIIPYYPANFPNGGSEGFLEGDEEFINPELLIDASSPACLIFQGLEDGLVNPEISASFDEAYDEAGNNNNCSVIYFPYAGHANDLHYSGFYSRIFLYYMERFLALHR